MTKKKLLLAILSLIFLAAISYWIYLNRPVATIDLEFPKTVSVGEEIRVPLKISTREAMNAAEFYFSYPIDLLEIQTVDQGGSFYELWIKDYPRFDNTKGIVELAGGLPKPGFTGRDGLVAVIVFKAKAVGVANITMDQSKSRILANDGLGTQIPADFNPITVTIK